MGQRKQVIDGALGQAHRECAVHQWQPLPQRLIERTRQARGSIDIEDMGLGNRRLPQRDVMAAGALEPGRVPGVLDLPVARRQHNDTNQRLALRAGTGLPCSVTMQNPPIQSAWVQLLANGQRPLTR